MRARRLAMTPAERELRELRRELLLWRAAAERAQLAHQVGLLTGGAGVWTPATLAVRAAFALRRSGFIETVLAALRLARHQPWIVSGTLAGLSRLRRTTLTRWLVVAGVVVLAAAWLRRQIRRGSDRGIESAPTEPAEDIVASNDGSAD